MADLESLDLDNYLSVFKAYWNFDEKLFYFFVKEQKAKIRISSAFNFGYDLIFCGYIFSNIVGFCYVNKVSKRFGFDLLQFTIFANSFISYGSFSFNKFFRGGTVAYNGHSFIRSCLNSSVEPILSKSFSNQNCTKYEDIICLSRECAENGGIIMSTNFIINFLKMHKDMLKDGSLE